MQEQYENKYFQKRNDIFENDYSYIVQSANYTFSQKANILRSQSQIEKKLYEKISIATKPATIKKSKPSKPKSVI